ncbi:MAG: sigma-70 family RNA polymerase sigma factor [Planctomycetota bacterium]
MRRLQAGEERAYEQLVREHMAAMLRVTRKLLAGEDDARDAVQDAFLSAFRSIDRFASGARLSTWLYRIAVNAALMRRRKSGRRPEIAIEELQPRFLDDGHHAEPVANWAEDAEQQVLSSERRAQVRAFIDQLPETYRTVLILRDIEELSTEETARILDASENAVKIRLHRARLALRELLAPMFQAE